MLYVESAAVSIISRKNSFRQWISREEFFKMIRLMVVQANLFAPVSLWCIVVPEPVIGVIPQIAVHADGNDGGTFQVFRYGVGHLE